MERAAWPEATRGENLGMAERVAERGSDTLLHLHY